MNTIVAISTAVGAGGIGIIRLSGKESFKIINKIFKPVKKEKIRGNTIKYGKIINPNNKEVIDEVLVSFFKKPFSYTTEDMCEINSHGGIIVTKQILELCLENGAILATPGEFTKRAFLNGRIDLSQAEATIDIINAKTKNEKIASIKQLGGGLSKKINEVQDQLVDVMSDIEASIDYPEYDIEELTEKQIIQKLEDAKIKVKELLDTFSKGKIIKEGISVAIVGRPNTGKSALLNAILKEDRAIVTNEEGTTRDTIEEMIDYKGIPLKIIDTAGIRKTESEAEKKGIEKSIKKAQESDVLIAVFDSSQKIKKEDRQILDLIKQRKENYIIVLNKKDLKSEIEKEEEIFKKENIIQTSAIKGEGIDKIFEKILQMFEVQKIDVKNEVLITNIRHKNILENTIKYIEKTIKAIKSKTPIDITAVNIKEVLEELGKITGSNISEDIINKIFSKFCLGK